MPTVVFILGLVVIAGCSHFDAFSWQDYPEAYDGFPEEYARVRYPELNDGDPLIVRNSYERRVPPKPEQSSIMDTYETFKRQAERVAVPGDEYNKLAGYTTTGSGQTQALSWQAATVMSILCVGAAVIGVVLGVMYWPKKSFGDPTDEGMQIIKHGKLDASPSDKSRSDQSLAKSAQMYHYQQQKQQMLAMEQASGRTQPFESEPESGSDIEEPDVNVYECPGLATAGEFDVANPLFQEEETNKDGPSTGTQQN